jgi:hypothetical protein
MKSQTSEGLADSLGAVGIVMFETSVRCTPTSAYFCDRFTHNSV